MHNTALPVEEASLLQDLETENWHPPADAGLRFANMLLDFIGYLLFSVLLGLFIGLIAAVTSSALAEGITTLSGFEEIAFSWLVYISYYTIIEGVTRGSSLGKLLTGTKAVREDGEPFTWGNAFMRSVCRLVPFEPFSAIDGSPWHDRWTNTKVIKKPR